MVLLLNILLISSCFMLVALAINTWKHLQINGMSGLFAMIVFFMVWVVGNLVEINASDFNWILWGRNVQQIGVFFTPLCSLIFSVGYTANRKLNKFVYIISVIEIISVILIFTDQYHHIMRERVVLQTDAVFGHAISVTSTKIGSVLVAFNFCVPLIALANFITFTRKVSGKLRRSLWLIIISIFLTFVVAVVQSTVLSQIGINIPIPVWNLPCVALIAYAVIKGGFIGVAPTALNKVFEVIDQGIIVLDENGKVIEHNRRASELMDDIGHSDSIKIGTDILALISGKNNPDEDSFSIDDLPAELNIAQKNRYISLVHHTLNAFRGKLVGYVLVLTDITYLKVRAEIDSLTGIYNREGMTNAFLDLQGQIESEAHLSAMIIDIDDFKKINDTYTHFGGDIILMDFVSTVQSLLSEKYFLGRLGGDEFVIVLPMEIEAVMTIAERLRKCISERSVQYLDHKIQYTISVGVASSVNTDCVLSDLLFKADLALYKAKHHGKNLVSM